MQTLEIQVPEGKTKFVKQFLKEMGVVVKVKKETVKPNADTIAAMTELKAGGLRSLDWFKRCLGILLM